MTILSDSGERAQDETGEKTGSNPERHRPTPASNQTGDQTSRESLER
jgi:hypothetical protein